VRNGPLITGADVQAAADALARVVPFTPLISCVDLAAEIGAAEVMLKLDSMQKGGAFKFRGAYNRIRLSLEEERPRRVVAYSSGNHGNAVAIAGEMFDLPCTVFIPKDISNYKRMALEERGATLISYDRHVEDRVSMAEEYAIAEGAVLVPPFDDPSVIAGQGTSTLEVINAGRTFDILIAPIGGGGLLAGNAVTAKELATDDVLVYGAETTQTDAAARSLREGKIVTIPPPETFVDAMRKTAIGNEPWKVFSRYLDGVGVVGEEDVIEALNYSLRILKLIVEPTSAVPLAALLKGRIPVSGKRVLLIISGGNVTVEDLTNILG